MSRKKTRGARLRKRQVYFDVLHYSVFITKQDNEVVPVFFLSVFTICFCYCIGKLLGLFAIAYLKENTVI